MTEKHILKINSERFILETVSSTTTLNDDFTSVPIVNNICSSLFLQLTGFLEQKFRAVIWTLATNDRDYRRLFLNNTSKFGEFSTYEHKNDAYKALVLCIGKIKHEPFDIKHKIKLKDSKSFVLSCFKNTIFYSNMHYEYYNFEKNEELMKPASITINPKDNGTISLIPLKENIELFKELINDRNKIAHNAEVVHNVKNDLMSLFSKEDNCRNFFIKIFLLIYVDKVLSETFAYYEKIMNEKNFFIC